MNSVDGKPLLKAVQEYKSTFNGKRILTIIEQLARAIRHLKANNIIWCNFNHDNIIYDGENVVICGFSQSRLKISRNFKIDKKVLGPRGLSRGCSRV